MFFIISKIILFLALPPSSLIIIMAFGILLIKRYPRLAKAFIVIGLLALYLISIRPVSDALIKPLESNSPPLPKDFSLNSASTIVILAGGAADLSWIGAKLAPSHSSTARLVYGLILYKQMPDAKLIISGGNGDPEKQNISEAAAMKDMAVELGVSAKDILIEGDSRNTIESANAFKRLAGDQSIILVTSAYHMKRASAMFRKMGMNIISAPTDYMSEQNKISLYSLIPKAGHLSASSIAFYEYISFIWYKLHGKV